jgi:DNA-binding SARP family transcriptional activator
MLEVEVLGPLVIRHDGRPIRKIPRKAGALLAYLACHPGQHLSRERLADLLWPYQGSEQARHSLRNCLLELRKALGSRDAIAANFVDCSVAALCDADMFKELSASDDGDDLASAMRLYRGEFLQDFHIASDPWDEWLTCEREKLHRIAGRGFGLLVEIATKAGSHDLAIEAGRRAVEIDSLSETAHRLLMQALAAAGHRAEAARQYRSCEFILRRELQIQPDPQTRALMAGILAAAPAARTVELSAPGTKSQILAAPPNIRRQPAAARVLPAPEGLRAECAALGIKGEQALAGIDGAVANKRLFREMTALLLRVAKHPSAVLEAA